MQQERESLCDAVERALTESAGTQALLDAAREWWAEEQERGRSRDLLPEATLQRWPCLSAWGWLVPSSDREERISADDEQSSAAGVQRETATDLAYRCLMPRGLGRVLTKEQASSSSDDEEEFATFRDLDVAEAEASALLIKRRALSATFYVTVVLAAGLRRLRWACAQKLSAWCELRALQETWLSAADAAPAPAVENAQLEQLPNMASRENVLNQRFSAWATSQQGQGVVAQLRWLIPTQEVLVSRIRSEIGASGAGVNQIRRACEPWGIPVREADGITWGCGRPRWTDVTLMLQTQCTCDGAAGAPVHR